MLRAAMRVSCLVVLTSSVVLVSLVMGHRHERNERHKHDDRHEMKGLVENLVKMEGDPINPLHQGAIMSMDHMREHLQKQIMLTPEEEEAISENEADFHFFRSHDTDLDNKLDGLELYAAITHGLHDQMEGMQFVNDDQRELTLKRIGVRLVLTVDQILREDDTDGDGLLSYPEYARARLASITLKEYNRPKNG